MECSDKFHANQFHANQGDATEGMIIVDRFIRYDASITVRPDHPLFAIALISRIYARTVFWPTLSWNFLLGRVLHRRNWWDRIDSHVIVGAYPFSRDVASLRGEGVRAVVNTCEEYRGPLREYAHHGIEQLHIPTTDFTHPRLQDIEAAVEFIQKYKLQNDTVYIHCKAGRARSATVALCWLIKYKNLSVEEAQRHLLSVRPHINPNLTQRPVVRQFQDALRDAKTDSALFPAIDRPLVVVSPPHT